MTNMLLTYFSWISPVYLLVWHLVIQRATIWHIMQEAVSYQWHTSLSIKPAQVLGLSSLILASDKIKAASIPVINESSMSLSEKERWQCANNFISWGKRFKQIKSLTIVCSENYIKNCLCYCTFIRAAVAQWLGCWFMINRSVVQVT